MSLGSSIAGSLLPIFLVIITGYLFRSIRFPGEEFWPLAERITYFVLFPCLLVQKTATASLDVGTVLPLLTVLAIAVLTIAGFMLFSRPFWTPGDAAFTSFFQGGIRFNTYVGLSAAYALFGETGLSLFAVAIAFLIPLINLLCVSVLVFFLRKEKGRWHAIVKEIVRNPLIIGCTAGIVLNLSGVGLHQSVDETLLIFGRASLPLGLLAVGAALDLSAAGASGKVVLVNSFLKLIILPVVVWGLSYVLQLDLMATSVAILFAALPGAPSAYILARQLGGDGPLMAGIVTAQIVLSIVTLPAAIALLVHG